MVIVNKKSILVRVTRDGVKKNKSFPYTPGDDASYHKAYHDAKLCDDEFKSLSEKSNTGYRFISIYKRTDGTVLIKGVVVIKGKQHTSIKSIRNVNDYRNKLLSVMSKIYTLIDLNIPEKISVKKGIETLNTVGLKIPVYLYKVTHHNTTYVVAAENKQQALELSAINADSITLIGRAENEIEIGVLCR